MITNIHDIPINRVRRRIQSNKVDKIVKSYVQDSSANLKELEEWHTYWDNLADFRRRYLINSDYNRGKQLNRIVTDSNGNKRRQIDIIRSLGKTPIVVNIIRETVKAILGQYRNAPSRSSVYTKKEEKGVGEMLTLALQSALDLNDFRELDVQQLETFLLSGCAISRINTKFYPTQQEYDLLVDNVNPCYVFFNTDVRDIRCNDLKIIGEILECKIDDVIHTYATDEVSADAIRAAFEHETLDYVSQGKTLSAEKVKNLDFYTPSSPDLVKIYVGWTRRNRFCVYVKDPLDGTRETVHDDYKQVIESIKRANTDRFMFLTTAGGLTDEEAKKSLIDYKLMSEEYWEYKVLTDKGYCLAQGESPFAHKEHPYVMLLRPLINGEVWGLVEDLIDIQDVINQNFMTMKWIVEQSAKGLLIIDKKAMIDSGYDIDDIAKKWTETGGVLALDLKPNVALPQEINSSGNIAVQQLLDMSLKLMEKVSGVNGAMKGERANSGTAASLYAQQTENSLTSIVNYVRNFEDYIRLRDEKALKVIIDTYDDGRFIDVFNDGVTDESRVWDSDKVKDVQFRLSIIKSNDSPLYTFAVEEQLQNLFAAQAIDVKTYLSKSKMPFAKSILDEMEAKEQAQAQNPMQQIDNQNI